MIGNPIDDDRFLSLVPNNSAPMLKYFPRPPLLENVLASLDSQDDLNVDLGICACHDRSPMIEKIMSSLRDLFPVRSPS